MIVSIAEAESVLKQKHEELSAMMALQPNRRADIQQTLKKQYSRVLISKQSNNEGIASRARRLSLSVFSGSGKSNSMRLKVTPQPKKPSSAKEVTQVYVIEELEKDDC